MRGCSRKWPVVFGGVLFQEMRAADINAGATARAILFSGGLQSEMFKTLESQGVINPGQVLTRVTPENREFKRELGFLVTLSLLRENVSGIAAMVRGHQACNRTRLGSRSDPRKLA